MCKPSEPANNIEKVFVREIGEHNGAKRVWIDSNRLEGTPFTAGTPITVFVKPNKITVMRGHVDSGEGTRLGISKVHSRRGKPVLDINNKEIEKNLPKIEKVTIIIRENEMEIIPLLKDQALGGECTGVDLTSVGLFSGGGLLDKAFQRAGFNPVFAVEMEEKYLETYEANHPGVPTCRCDINDLDFRLLPKHPSIALIGFPCTRFTNLRMDLKRKRKENGEPDEGWDTVKLAFAALNALLFMEPEMIALEEVPPFAGTVSEELFLNTLMAHGYVSQYKTIIDGEDYGCLSQRRRYCLIASKNPDFQIEITPERVCAPMTIGDILEIPAAEREWHDETTNKTVKMLKNIEKGHIAKGRNFRMKAFTVDDTCVSALSGDYNRCRVSDPVLTDGAGRYSRFTEREVARLMGVPDDFELKGCRGVRYQVAGQGVQMDAWTSVAMQTRSAYERTREDPLASA